MKMVFVAQPNEMWDYKRESDRPSGDKCEILDAQRLHCIAEVLSTAL